MASSKLVPPDGGYGWIIILAYALSHVMVIPILQNFGLIFKDVFEEMGISATNGSFIITTSGALMMIANFINGPVLKYFGFRKAACLSAIVSTVGLLFTAYSSTLTQFLLSYSLTTSIGVGLATGTYPYALNHYFVKRRSYAMGISMTIAAVGPIFMPQVISLLLYFYDVRGTMVILSGFAANSMVTAVLLQPVEWHMVKETIEEVEGETKNVDVNDDKDDNLNAGNEHISDKSTIPINHEVPAIFGYDAGLGGSVLSLRGDVEQQWTSRRTSCKSTNEELTTQKRSSITTATGDKITAEAVSLIPKLASCEEAVQKQTWIRKLLQFIVTIFDLELLKDPIYINIMLGMSLAQFAELSFSLFTPFIMADFNLTTHQIATFLSILSTADLCLRFLAPFIGEFFKQPPRIMYMFSLLLLISTRFTLLLFSQYEALLGVAILIGVAKGVRTVYWYLVIPSYVPLEKLANACGLQLLLNGIIVLVAGPILGFIRDVTGSYRNCILVTNVFTSLTFVMWSLEFLCLKYRFRKVKTPEVPMETGCSGNTCS